MHVHVSMGIGKERERRLPAPWSGDPLMLGGGRRMRTETTICKGREQKKRFVQERTSGRTECM